MLTPEPISVQWGIRGNETLTMENKMFTLIPSRAKNENDKTFGRYQVLKDGTKYRKLMANGKTRESICTGGMELWLTSLEASEAIELYKENN